MSVCARARICKKKKRKKERKKKDGRSCVQARETRLQWNQPSDCKIKRLRSLSLSGFSRIFIGPFCPVCATTRRSPCFLYPSLSFSCLLPSSFFFSSIACACLHKSIKGALVRKTVKYVKLFDLQRWGSSLNLY